MSSLFALALKAVALMLLPAWSKYDPYYLDNEALKYIDYDLDVKVFADGEKRLLDVEEYERHKKQMHYSDDLDFILKENVKILVDWINNGRGPFSDAYVNIWYKRYVELKNR